MNGKIKRVLALLLCGTMAVSMFACEDAENKDENDGKISSSLFGGVTSSSEKNSSSKNNSNSSSSSSNNEGSSSWWGSSLDSSEDSSEDSSSWWGPSSDSSSSSDGSSDDDEVGQIPGMIDQNIELLDLGSDFSPNYYPDKTKLKQQEGCIDVAIVFEGAEKGWQALAAEYERIHSGGVVVQLNTSLSADKYKETLNFEAGNSKTDWDIVQGNLLNDTAKYCVNMYADVYKKNPYAGVNHYWGNVLNREAYITGSVGSDTSVYLLNTENLQTAWFVNKDAMDAAVAKGYKNAEGKAENPKTWDDLMNLCAKMEEVGYENPLGISLDAESVDSNQFTWLLRIYGDYYYRNEYNMIVYDSDYNVDLTAEDPESDSGYNVQPTKFFNLVLDDEEAHYVGAKSDKYKDFISQFKKMEPYLQSDVLQKSQADFRSEFRSQSAGKKSPQIILDYAGQGLSYAGSDKIEMDFFDYPIMESDYVEEEHTLLRDVGGSGGYLSILSHDRKQNDLNLDFLKFVLSPYGQSIYYNALSQAELSPNGITTVKNELVVMPQAWKTFFATDKISFTGFSDNNEFVRNFIRELGASQVTKTDCKNLWQQYLTGKKTTENFQTEWHASLLKGWESYAGQQNWNIDCYKIWGGPTD